MGKKLISIGEALIDFMPGESGKAIAEVGSFAPAVGGAPANVCGAFSKLGGESAMITQLGTDSFGDKIIKEFQQNGINCDWVKRTTKANTSLAFVALQENGMREFSFYRNPGADMLYSPDDLENTMFEDAYALHFCSVSLGDFPMKEAHKKAILCAAEYDTIISFDPNLRPALWTSEEDMVAAVKEFMPLADILKISDEELEVLTGTSDIKEALPVLFQGNVKMVIYTEGSKGARAYTKNAEGFAASKKVNAVDTTGAGDGFIGSFLYKLYTDGVTRDTISELTDEQISDYLKFSNTFCGISVQKKGAIISYPTMEEVLAQM